MRAVAILVIIGVCSSADSVLAQHMTNLSIMCGKEGAPYYDFCKRLEGLVQGRCGAKLQVKASQGSDANLNAPPERNGTQLKLSQSDMLAYAEREAGKKSNLPEVKRRLNQWLQHRAVAFLFREQVHIVSLQTKNIQSLKDLKGKRVGIGEEFSGTWITATRILELAKITFEPPNPPPVMIDLKSSLTRLFSDELDAFFFVGSAPVPDIVEASRRGALRFVRIDWQDKYRPDYKPDSLRRKDYGWLDGDVDTLNTTAVLATYPYDNDDESCRNIAAIAKLMQHNEQKLHRNPNEDDWFLNFTSPVSPWKRSECVRRYFSQIDDPADNNQCVIEPPVTERSVCDCEKLRRDRDRALCRIAPQLVCPSRRRAVGPAASHAEARPRGQQHGR